MKKKIKTDLINHIYELLKEKKYEEYINLIRKDKKTRELIKQTFHLSPFKDDSTIIKLHAHLGEIADLHLKTLYPHNIAPDYRSEPSHPFYVYYLKMKDDLVAELAELILNNIPSKPNVTIPLNYEERMDDLQTKKKSIFGF